MSPQAVEALKDELRGCGYDDALLQSGYRMGTDQGKVEVPLVGFAHEPFDALSACIAATTAPGEPARTVATLRDLGAPVVFVLHDRAWQWWRQTAGEPQFEHQVPLQDVPRFFRERRADFAPASLYRAKTFGRFDRPLQLAFVDLDLMPLVERRLGRQLTEIIEQLLGRIQSHFPQRKPGRDFSRWLFQRALWLLAAKLLQDKRVPAFASLDLGTPDEVFRLVGAHYGAAKPFALGGRRERDALVDAARTLEHLSLEHVTTEALAEVYESALVDPQVRRHLGIHGTPPYLADYIVWRLEPWIREIPVDERQVFEPTAGHAGFLVAAMRVLRELLPRDWSAARRHRYLRERLRGMEVDPFAVEVARLSLTLADAPHPDGWHLQQADVFTGDLPGEAARSTIVLSNPPFENFREHEKDQYRPAGRALHVNKATELLARLLPHLRPGSVCGLVVPQGLLHNTDAQALRQRLLADFEILEVCVLPDRVFRFSDAESAVILARRSGPGAPATRTLRYRRVREHHRERFRQTYEASFETDLQQACFAESSAAELCVRELADVWDWCARYPRLADLADVGQGLTYHGRAKLPARTQTTSGHRFPDAVRGYERVGHNLMLHEQPQLCWLNLQPAVVRRAGTGTTRGQAQVLLNYAPIGRGPWRLKAVMDRVGHPVTSRFLTVRPHAGQPLEFLWALLNSPVANAWVFDWSSKRDILAGNMRQFPVPPSSAANCQRIAAAARRYIEAASGDPPLFRTSQPVDRDTLRDLLLLVDAEVMALYDLPPRLERRLLDIFAGYPRPGVPFEMTRYYAADYESYTPLRVYISSSFRRSTSEQILARLREPVPADVVAALKHAAQAWRE